MKAVLFAKMSGAGNDFVVIDNRKNAVKNPKTFAIAVCDRKMSVGADGVLLVERSKKADYKMRIINADGSEAEMCGNGVRCFAKFVYEKKLTDKTELVVETGAGLIKPSLTVEDGKVTWVRVDMGEPRLTRGLIPMTGEAEAPAQGVEIAVADAVYTASCVSMGNPHCIIFVDEITDAMVLGHGPLLEVHELFPRKTNVEFVQVLSPTEVRMRVWERGAGETMACGTGACATTVAAILAGHTGREVTVHLLGGDLKIEWAENNHIYMTGPATEAFNGEVAEEFIAAAKL